MFYQIQVPVTGEEFMFSGTEKKMWEFQIKIYFKRIETTLTTRLGQ